MNKDTRILIVGLGLIGGSYAMALSKKGFHVDAIDTNQDSIKYGIENNLICNKESEEEIIKKSDLIVLSLYPTKNIEWIKNNSHFIKKGAIITDTSGVKSKIIDDIQSNIKNAEFIASHPMAGREVSGVRNANDEIFKGANFLITPTEKNTEASILLLKELAEILGFGNIEIITPLFHDEMIGFLSQLTHVIAVSLMNSHESEHLIRYTGDSFRDLTRIAKINENLWSELFILNKDILCENIDLFVKEMLTFKKLLQDNDVVKLKEKMISSTNSRKLFDKR